MVDEIDHSYHNPPLRIPVKLKYGGNEVPKLTRLRCENPNMVNQSDEDLPESLWVYKTE